MRACAKWQEVVVSDRIAVLSDPSANRSIFWSCVPHQIMCYALDDVLPRVWLLCAKQNSGMGPPCAQ